MAEIVVNSGLIIKPGILPYQVSVRRDLGDILHELESIKRVFTNVGREDKRETNALLKRIRDLNGKYSDLLQSCSKGLEEELASQPNSYQTYFKPLYNFLSRASNMHTLLPFLTYIHMFPDGTPSYTVFEEHTDFIALRIDEAIATCKAYISLISQTNAEQEASVDVSSLVAKAFIIAREKSVRRTNELELNSSSPLFEKDDDKLRSDFQHLKQKAQRTSIVTSQHNSNIYTYPDLVFFYLVNTFDNHFKAAEGRYGKGNVRSHPKVTVKVQSYGEHHVTVMSRDNGIGIPVTSMADLFDPDQEQPKIYRGYQRGNGRTLPIYPHICDLLQSALVVKSEGRNKGAEFTLILPKDVQANREIVYAPH